MSDAFPSENLAACAHELTMEYRPARSLRQALMAPFQRPQPVRALDRVSFDIKYGQIAGIVGLNGAGKTTLLKLMCDLLAPTSGTLTILGHRVPSEGIMRLRAAVGFVPSDERSFFWRLTGRENLQFFAALYQLTPRLAAYRIDELLNEFGMAERADQLFRDCSSGMRKRLAIIRGLLHKPRLLILDEPTNSLDPHWDRYLRQYIGEWVQAAPQRAVIWSTHRLEEVSQLCNLVLQLDAGRLSISTVSDEASLVAADSIGVK